MLKTGITKSFVSEVTNENVHKDKQQRAKNMAFIYRKLYGQPKRRNQNEKKNKNSSKES